MYIVDDIRSIAIRLNSYTLFGPEKTHLTDRNILPQRYVPYYMQKTTFIKYIKRQ